MSRTLQPLCTECRYKRAAIIYRGRTLCGKCAIKLYHPHLMEKEE